MTTETGDFDVLYVNGEEYVSSGSTTGTRNLALPSSTAGTAITSATDLVLLGDEAGDHFTTAVRTILVGSQFYDGTLFVDATDHIHIGSAQGPRDDDYSSGSDWNNQITIGNGAGNYINSNVSYSIFIGHDAGGVSDGLIVPTAAFIRCVGIGRDSILEGTEGNIVAIGYQTLSVGGDGGESVLIGYQAGKTASSQDSNTIIGSLACGVPSSNTVAIGSLADTSSVTPGGSGTSVCIGYHACHSTDLINSSCTNNVIIGSEAMSLSGVINGASNNVIIGYDAGDTLLTGDDNIILGARSDVTSSAAVNQIVIGDNTTSAGDNTVTFNASLTTIRIAGLGSHAAATTLSMDSNGDIKKDGSSIRYKKDVTPIELDCSKIMDLDVISFDWKENDEPSFGMIAEQVHEVYPELVTYYKDENDIEQIQSVNYRMLNVLMLSEILAL